jgi:pilus assembly protein CpaE
MEKISIVIALDTTEAINAVRNAAQRHGLEVVLEEAPNTEVDAFLERVSRSRPQIVFVETSRARGPVHGLVEALRSAAGSAAVVVVHPNPDPEIILEAMRAGAAEFIYPPFNLNAERSLERWLRERDGGCRTAAGKTLGFLSVKGGCGATTMACQVAAELKRCCGKSVLLADFDPDLGIIAFLLKTKSPYSMADALENAGRLDRSMWQAYAATGPSGISVLSAPDEPGLATANPDQSARFFRFVRSEYDYTVVDLGRGVTRFNIAAMTDIDCTCLVTTMAVPALHRARRTIRTLRNGGCTADRLRVIVNYMPRRQDVSLAELQKMIEFPIYAAVSEDAHAVSDGYSQNGLVSTGTQLGKQIAALACRLTGQPEKEPRRFSLFARA